MQTLQMQKTYLLAVDAGGDLYAIELNRDRTPREVVAQVLDYGSWVKDLGHEDISALLPNPICLTRAKRSVHRVL